MISPEEVQKLANLSRIEISEDEKVIFAKNIDSILGYVKQIGNITQYAGEDIPEVRNVLRNDGEPHESGLYTKEILQQAPNQEDGYVKVKKILNS